MVYLGVLLNCLSDIVQNKIYLKKFPLDIIINETNQFLKFSSNKVKQQIIISLYGMASGDQFASDNSLSKPSLQQ